MTVSKLTTSTDVYEVQQKINEIIDGYLPLSGGTLTSNLFLQGADSKLFGFKITESGNNVDVGWDWSSVAGSGAAFRSSAHAAAGNFIFFARSSVGTKQLVGTPGGSLKWDNQEVLRANSNLDATKLTGTINTARIPIDNSTITVNGSGKLQATGGGGSGADTTLSNVTALDSSFISLLETNNFIPFLFSIASTSVYNGYIIFPDKMCFQWGTHGNVNTTIPLLVPMADANYLLYSTRIASGSGVAYTKTATAIKPSAAWAANYFIIGLSNT